MTTIYHIDHQGNISDSVPNLLLASAMKRLSETEEFSNIDNMKGLDVVVSRQPFVDNPSMVSFPAERCFVALVTEKGSVSVEINGLLHRFQNGKVFKKNIGLPKQPRDAKESQPPESSITVSPSLLSKKGKP